MTLGNGLEALLISDATLDKAAVSLSVGVGHLSDPDDLPGLAHFCEHMLFLGTAPFPDEAGYKLHLSQNSGSANAFTSLDETNYHLSVHPLAIPGESGTLARHASFFISPLFLASCTERELKAVDSEFRRNLQLDSRWAHAHAHVMNEVADSSISGACSSSARRRVTATQVPSTGSLALVSDLPEKSVLVF